MSDTAGTPEDAHEGESGPQEDTSVPAKADALVEILDPLTARQAAAVRFYTTRGSGAFGNKKEAMRLAGYAETTRSNDVFGKPYVKEAVDQIREWQVRQDSDVIESIRAISGDARDELISQLDIGKGLRIIDPTEIFGEGLDKVEGEDDHNRLRELNKHNRVVAKLMRERRQAAELLLAYAEGTPEQRMKVTRTREASDLEKWLMNLPEEKFDALVGELFGIEEEGETGPPEAEGPVLEGEYEVLDSGHEEGDR